MLLRIPFGAEQSEHNNGQFLGIIGLVILAIGAKHYKAREKA